MRDWVSYTTAILTLVACGGAPPAQAPETAQTDETAPATPAGAPTPAEDTGANSATDDNQFALRNSDTAGDAHGVAPSKIKPTATEAAMKFFVVDKDKGPVPGIVISLTAPDGKRYYTEETDAKGYAEVLVPVGKKYDLVYLSLGQRDVAASVPVADEPNQNIKLTLRYKGYQKPGVEPRFVLKGVEFDTGKATIRPESLPRLDMVVEYMQHKKDARIEISGHTDNVGKKQANKLLSQKRADACRDYLIKQGIDGSRIKAIGHGDERPIDSNDTEQGRQANRRIEATEL